MCVMFLQELVEIINDYVDNNNNNDNNNDNIYNNNSNNNNIDNNNNNNNIDNNDNWYGDYYEIHKSLITFHTHKVEGETPW